MSYLFTPKKKETKSLNPEDDLNSFANLSLRTNSVQVKTKLSSQYDIFNDAFADIVLKINEFNLIEKHKNTIYCMFN